MAISGDVNLDANSCGFSLPADSCVGDGVGDPFAGGKSGPKPSAAAMSAPSGGDPYAGGKSAGRAGAQGGAIPIVMSGPDLPDDYDTDDPNRA